jgi:hypothetical protein
LVACADEISFVAPSIRYADARIGLLSVGSHAFYGYWRIDPSADYGPLNGIARHRINLNPIRENWDDLLRLAGSLKLGLVQATSIMRTLRIDDSPNQAGAIGC